MFRNKMLVKCLVGSALAVGGLFQVGAISTAGVLWGAVLTRSLGSAPLHAPGADKSKSVEWPAHGTAPDRPILRVSADELDNAYRKDIATADLTYLNKAVELSGVTGNVEKDAQGRYFIGVVHDRFVKTPSRPPRVGTIDDVTRAIAEAGLISGKSVPAVILYIRQKDLNLFAGIGGKTITVRGVCKGTRPEPTATPEYEIIVDDCMFVAGK
jgi:hypothetical protein